MKPKQEDKQTKLNRLLVKRAIDKQPNPEIEKLQAEIDLLNYGIVLNSVKV
jgi:ubiquitin